MHFLGRRGTKGKKERDTVQGAYSMSEERYVTRPQFSMAPAEKSGMAIISSFGRGIKRPSL